jgi:hypothetical protein
MSDSGLFAAEKATFETNRAQLFSEHPGKYVLVKGDDILGVFDTENDAVREGYARFGSQAFYVRQITQFDNPIHFNSRLVEV